MWLNDLIDVTVTYMMYVVRDRTDVAKGPN